MSFKLGDIVKLKGDEDRNYMCVKQITTYDKQLVAEHRGRSAQGDFCEFELVTGDDILDKLKSVLVNHSVIDSCYNNNCFNFESEMFHIKYNLFESGVNFNVRVRKTGMGQSFYEIDHVINFINRCENKIKSLKEVVDDLILAETQLVNKPSKDTLLNAKRCRAKFEEYLPRCL